MEDDKSRQLETQSNEPIKVQLGVPFKVTPDFVKGMAIFHREIDGFIDRDKTMHYPPIILEVESLGKAEFHLEADASTVKGKIKTDVATPAGPMALISQMDDSAPRLLPYCLPLTPSFVIDVPMEDFDNEVTVEIVMRVKYNGKERWFRVTTAGDPYSTLFSQNKEDESTERHLLDEWYEITNDVDNHCVIQLPQSMDTFEDIEFTISRI
jgi:hypothetical protein